MKADGRFLIVVCGCTGTGKSDLGIEIAKKYNGEIISADSMQIYKDLDIATNKVTTEEMQNIPHHMMSFYDPRQSDFNVHLFRDEVIKIMERLWSQGKLPIIVGGTSYYVESIIYENYLIPSNTSKKDKLRTRLLSENPTDDELYELLLKVDPASACQIHRHNRFRVLRALEIYYVTGKTKSEHLMNQKSSSKSFFNSQNQFGGRLRYQNTLLINLDAEKSVLDERLDCRVEKMVNKGLKRELEKFYNDYGNELETHGIMQSIGLKEFLPYLQLEPKQRQSTFGEKLFRQGCDLLKLHTRQYCRKQRNWLYHRILLRAQIREIPKYVSLNASHDFFKKLVPVALKIVTNFLQLKDPLTNLESETNPVLMPLPENAEKMKNILAESDYQTKSNQIFYCDRCQIEIQSEKSWKEHLLGKRHRKMVAIKSKLDRKVDDSKKKDVAGLEKQQHAISSST